MAASDTLVRVVTELSAARDLLTVMGTVRRAARELTGADGATFVVREGDLCHYADEDAIGPLWKGRRFPARDCISGWAMENKQAAIVEDVYADSRIPRSAYEPTFVRSLIMVPIRAADPVGAIGVYWARPRRAASEEILLVQALADSTAVALENVRALEEARRWRALLAEASDMVWTMDPDAAGGEMAGITRWWEGITGRSLAGQLTPNAWLDDLHPEDRETVAAAWSASVSAPVPFRTEYRIKAQDGTFRHVRVRAVAVPRPHGSHELVGMLTDVTREREAERAARSLLEREVQARRHTDQILERIADGFVSIDREWRYSYVNKRAGELLGREPEELIGQGVWTLFPEAAGGPIKAALERALATQQVVFTEEYFGPWGRWFENRIYPSETGISVFFTDVTENRKAKEALEEARLRLALAIQASSVGFWEWDASTQEFRSTPECHRQLGYEPDASDDSIDEWRARMHPDEREGVLQRLATRAGAPGEAFQQEMRLRHRDGSYRWVLWKAAGVRVGSGGASRIHGCQVDITDLKRAQDDRERLHREVEGEKRRLERLAECVPAGIVMVAAPSGRLIFSNRRASEVFGPALDVLDEQLRERAGRSADTGVTTLDVIAQVLASGKAMLDREVGLGTEEGRHTRLLASAVPVEGADGRLEAVVASFHDVTDSHEAREALRQLSRRLLVAQDEERRRISRDLHDDLAQVLTAVKMSLAALPPGVAPAAFDGSVRSAIEIVDRSIRQTRDLSLRLHPPMLDVLGLGPTLRWFVAERMRGLGLAAHLTIELTRARLGADVENACFRVVQEALTNILRHARAKQIWVSLHEERGSLVMVIRDDGCGFEPLATRARAAAAKFAGLAGMEERVALAGGGFALRSKPGKGTEIHVRFALETES